MVKIGQLVTKIQNILEDVYSILYNINLFEKLEKKTSAKQFYFFVECLDTKFCPNRHSGRKVENVQCTYMFRVDKKPLQKHSPWLNFGAFLACYSMVILVIFTYFYRSITRSINALFL